jgi:crossover junction endodeoxyribonuclease RusA
MIPFEFLIPKRPVSLQTRNRQNLQAWKEYVRGEATKIWPKNTPPLDKLDLRCSMVYICGEDSPADIDNIIKPIQDALVGVVFIDDFLVVSVDSHRRAMTDPFDVAALPELLMSGVVSGSECVYVKISLAEKIQEYL